MQSDIFTLEVSAVLHSTDSGLDVHLFSGLNDVHI